MHIKKMEKEMRMTEDEKGALLARVLQEKKSLLEEKNREIEEISSKLTREVSLLTGNLSEAKSEVVTLNDKMEKMRQHLEKLSMMRRCTLTMKLAVV